jgi:hypothetical protein
MFDVPDGLLDRMYCIAQRAANVERRKPLPLPG